jgi:lysophospholipase L1-like esterase
MHTCGIRIDFYTDSSSLTVSVGAEGKYEVLVDGLTAFWQVFAGPDTFSIPLEAGSHRVTIVLPSHTPGVIRSVELDDGATLESIEYPCRIIFYGDSITQGYDALHTYKRYAARIAESMEAEEMNKAISGEFFFPPLAETDDDFEPDYVTVAYGTNDWSKTKREDFQRKSKAFYTSLSKKYPKAKIFGITPLWRKDYQEYREFGLFEDMINDTVKAVEGLENVILLHGFDMVPKEPKYFGDLRLHPRDEGFDHYFENLNKEIQKYI